MSKYKKSDTKAKAAEKALIITTSFVFFYLLACLYFSNHFYFQTELNGVNVSLKSYKTAEKMIRKHIKDYRLLLIGRNKETEVITGQELELRYNENSKLRNIIKSQHPLKWIISLFKKQKITIHDLYLYNSSSLNKVMSNLNCFNSPCIEPQNVSFEYVNGNYILIREKYGNKLNKDKLISCIKEAVQYGKTNLDIQAQDCYINPKYTIKSEKAYRTMELLNKYVKSKIYYQFGSKVEVLDGSTLHRWLRVDSNLDVIISKAEIENYVRYLSDTYDTIGKTRSFVTSLGKTVEVKGGIYGWKINQDEETQALFEHIKNGETVAKEPAYSLRAVTREGNEIGDTYIEINITRQYLWYYKKGKLIAGGPVVTGNPNTGNATVLGTYSIVYKQRDAVLTGPGYEAKVRYWMPFYGGIGVHDASWRNRFGGDIYKRNGSHGCVNAPYILAKTIFDNIEEGTPVICYEE